MVTSVTNPKEGEPEPAAAPAARPKLLGLRIGRTLAGSLTLLALAAYASISVYRHEHYASNAFDLAVQDQTVWGYSRGEFIYNTVLGIPNLLGDHFHPMLATLAPFMLIWNSAEVLLVAQAVLLALAGIPIYLWAERELGPLAGVAFQAAYLVFWGVLAGVIYDFHHAAFAVPALSTALYATLTRRNWLLVPAVVWAMLTREDIALVIPALGGGVAYRHWTYDALGTGPLSAASYVVRHPIDSLKVLFTPATKTRVWIGSFAAFALLPLASPVLLVALPSFLERFWSSSPNFWSFHFQYSMVPAPILAFAAMDTCVRVARSLRGRWAAATRLALPLAALAASVIVTVAVNPLAEVRTYLPDSRVAEINDCLGTIPGGASVAASNTLVPHLSHRAEIYEITLHPSADYVAVDPSTYPDFFNGEEDQLRNVVRGDLAAGYGIVCAKGTTLVLARADSTLSLTPQLNAWLAGKCSGRACS